MSDAQPTHGATSHGFAAPGASAPDPRVSDGAIVAGVPVGLSVDVVIVVDPDLHKNRATATHDRGGLTEIVQTVAWGNGGEQFIYSDSRQPIDDVGDRNWERSFEYFLARVRDTLVARALELHDAAKHVTAKARRSAAQEPPDGR